MTVEEKATAYANMQAITSQPRYQIKCAYKDGYTQGLYDKHADREEDIIHLSKENEELKEEIKYLEDILKTHKVYFDYKMHKSAK